ncbi:MAG: hypothetical protein LBK05_10240 [Treponema sp.]|jgi:hypothetical protein|nr:hypothetical protein [Treponema sp.]
MKRWFLSIITLFFCAAFAFAQPGPPGQGQNPDGTNSGPGQLPEALSIQGTLAFVNGQIAVTSGETTYYVWGLDRLFGFVDGLKEGASVKLDGYAADIPIAPEYKFFFTEKLTFNGKEYGGLLPGRRVGQGFRGRPGMPGFPHEFPPPGGMTRDRRHMRRQSPQHQRHYFDRRREND